VFNVCLAITNRDMLVASIGLYSTLNPNNLVFQKKFHAQQVLDIYFCLLDLNRPMGLFLLVSSLPHRPIINVFMVLSLKTLVNALESYILLTLLAL
jgi:hypothetical protein